MPTLSNADISQIPIVPESTGLFIAAPPAVPIPSAGLLNSPLFALPSSQLSQSIPTPPLPQIPPLASQALTLPYRPPATIRTSQNDSASTRPASGVTFLPPVTGAPLKRTLDREEVLKKAKARREQLVAELARTRVELWETSIEQGVLLNLLKDDRLK